MDVGSTSRAPTTGSTTSTTPARPVAATPEDERIDDDPDEGEELPDHLDLDVEVPEADALDQRRDAPLPDDDPRSD